MDYNYDSYKLLQMAIENDIISIDDLCRQLNDMNRKKILTEVHQYKIWSGDSVSKGKKYKFWYTYLPDKSFSNGKRLVKRSSLNKLEDVIVDFYNGKVPVKQENKRSFKTVFQNWVSFKQNIVSDSTVYRYNTDYSRFFENTAFENIDVRDINEEKILIFLSDTVKRLNLTQKAMKTLAGYINECMESARANKYIVVNPYTYVKPKLKLISKMCSEGRKKSEEERVISKEDIKALLDKFQEDYILHPEYITPYAVEFAIYTGCRVGEIAALRWSDIQDGIITIRSSEKAHRVKGEPTTYSIEGTKTGKERKIPVTPHIQDLLERVEKAENNIGCKNEFVFSNKNGRIISSRISDCIRKKCIQAGINQKSIHACRRTVNSTLRCLGMTSPVAASLMGHTEEVNENYYTYDVSKIEQKKKYLEQANTILAN